MPPTCSTRANSGAFATCLNSKDYSKPIPGAFATCINFKEASKPVPGAFAARINFKDASRPIPCTPLPLYERLDQLQQQHKAAHAARHAAAEQQQQEQQGGGPGAPTPDQGPSAVGALQLQQQQLVQHELADRATKLFVSGGLAGAVSRTATAPMDRLKLLLQVHDQRGVMTVREGLRRMASERTIKAYFRGNGANVLKNIPETALKLTANDAVKRLVATGSAGSGGHGAVGGPSLSAAERVVIGGLAGAIAQAAVYPLEVIQTRLSVSPRGTYRGIFDTLGKVWRCEGPGAFYRGIMPCMVGIWPYAGIDIAMFELLKEALIKHHTAAAARAAAAATTPQERQLLEAKQAAQRPLVWPAAAAAAFPTPASMAVHTASVRHADRDRQMRARAQQGAAGQDGSLGGLGSGQGPGQGQEVSPGQGPGQGQEHGLYPGRGTWDDGCRGAPGLAPLSCSSSPAASEPPASPLPSHGAAPAPLQHGDYLDPVASASASAAATGTAVGPAAAPTAAAEGTAVAILASQHESMHQAPRSGFRSPGAGPVGSPAPHPTWDSNSKAGHVGPPHRHLHAAAVPTYQLLLAGMASSSLGQLVAYPFSLARTRLQAQGVSGAARQYKGMLDVLLKATRYEGVRGLYKGVLPDLMKTAPAAGISWAVFEASKGWLDA